MDEDDSLNIIESAIAASLDHTEMDDEQAAQKVAELFELSREDCKNSSIASCRESAAGNLAYIREDIKGFEERNF